MLVEALISLILVSLVAVIDLLGFEISFLVQFLDEESVLWLCNLILFGNWFLEDFHFDLRRLDVVNSILNHFVHHVVDVLGLHLTLRVPFGLLFHDFQRLDFTFRLFNELFFVAYLTQLDEFRGLFFLELLPVVASLSFHLDLGEIVLLELVNKILEVVGVADLDFFVFGVNEGNFGVLEGQIEQFFEEALETEEILVLFVELHLLGLVHVIDL